MSRIDHTSSRFQRTKHTGRRFQAVTSEGTRHAWYCTVLKVCLAACAASCGHRGHSPAALASLFVSSTDLRDSDPRGRGGRWASPSPPGPADSCCNARRAEPRSFKVVATESLVLEPTPWRAGKRQPWSWDQPATTGQPRRDAGDGPPSGHWVAFPTHCEACIWFHSTQMASWDFVFLLSPQFTSWEQPPEHCVESPR